MAVDLNGTSHTVGLVRHGQHSVRWITRGIEKRWTSIRGSVHFLPSDDDHHTFVTSHAAEFVYNALVLPRGHVTGILASEQQEPRFEVHRVLNPCDVILQDSITRVFDAYSHEDDSVAIRADEAARRLVLRLTELCGGGKPDWHDDASVFDRRTLLGLVAYVDGNLRLPPNLSELSLRTGLSPSHFAKKFRQTTGLSLHRFINRRRIAAAMELLRDPSQSLAGVALDLGFSSQSHFTHLFSGLTGMTPAKYQKQFRRPVG